MFTYISIEEFADGVVKNNKDTNRKELIASLRESLAAKKNGARCMICGAPIWAAGSGVTGTYLCFTCTTGEADDSEDCNGVQREHNKKLNNGLPILHKVPPKRDYGRYFCIMAEKGGTSHGGLTEKLSLFFHAKKQEVNAYGR